MDQVKAFPVEQTSQAKAGLLSTLWKNRHPYIFISPFFILYAIFGLFPMVFSLILSVTEWNGVGPLRFNGLTNWDRMLHDTVFWQSFLNGVILFFLYVPVMLVSALGLAVILNSPRIRGFRVFRAIIFLPFITNMVAAGFAFQILLTKNNGLINVVLGTFGIPEVPWLESVWGARISLALLIMWAWLGYNMVLMLAGLQTIPGDLVEAARVDGANRIQAFFRITLPLMRPILLFCAVISLMGSFGLFAEVRTLTNSGPMNATITPMIKIYNNAFQQFQLGYASTLSYTYFAILIVLTFIQFRYLGRNNT
jgi:ABC-type sugar transport system permease subunit